MPTIKQRLDQDTTLDTRTALSANSILKLVEFCLTMTYFQYGGKFYQQKDGATIGSPLSPIVANIYMESFEEQAIETATDKPTLWLRYVGDTYVHCDYGREALDKFLIHLNSRRPNITFTMEIETDDKLPFLDVPMIRDNETQTLRTEVFRKPTHTDRYLHYRSYHHHSIKQGIIRTLTHRCHSICKDEVSRKAEQQHLNQVFKSNGYPTRFIDRANRSQQRPHGQ